DLTCELADVLERQGQADQAVAERKQAILAYQAVVKGARQGPADAVGGLVAFWKLQVLYQRTSQYDQALELTRDQADQWSGSLLGPRWHGEHGRLQILQGEYAL